MSHLAEDRDRKRREQDFHNRTFADETRKSAEKFYTVVESSWVRYQEILRSLCAGKKVLEYGCGPGSYAFFMTGVGAQVTGIDISVTAIDLARKRARGPTSVVPMFYVMDAEHLAFPEDSFDVVCGRAILHHLDVDRSLSEVSRVLRQSGTAVFMEPLGHNPLINFYRAKTPHLRTKDEHPLLIDDLQKIERRFRSVRFRYFHLLTLCAVPFRRVPGYSHAVQLLARMDQLLFRLLPFLRKYAWTIVMELSGSVP